MEINKLPQELIESIKSFLWGNTVIWKKKLNIVNLLPLYPNVKLSSVSSYRLYNNIIDSEECVFCRKCGEKTLWFPFSFYYSNSCEVCVKY